MVGDVVAPETERDFEHAGGEQFGGGGIVVGFDGGTFEFEGGAQRREIAWVGRAGGFDEIAHQGSADERDCRAAAQKMAPRTTFHKHLR